MGRPFIIVFLAAGCASSSAPSRRPAPAAAEAAPAAAVAPEHAPRASPRLPLGEHVALTDTIDNHFAGRGSKRLHVQLDRPLYRPGDTVWIKSWSVMTRGLRPDPQGEIIYELLDPQGQVLQSRRVVQQNGTATNDITLDESAPGGMWKLRATSPTGDVDERPFVVASYSTPRIRKELEFVREAYGPGDRVQALVELAQTTGEPLADTEVRALIQVDGRTVLEKVLRTDSTGAVLVSAALPEDLSSPDGLLTVLVEQGGITESISRSVPIVLADVSLDFFPEGGDLVPGLPGRVYFEATNVHGEPADVHGVIEDDRGRQVATFKSTHDGMGRVSFTPVARTTYVARITSPAGIEARYELPAATPDGCVLHAYDDVQSVNPEIRVGVRCKTDREVLVTGVLRETALDAARVTAGPKREAMVYLDPGEHSDKQGAVRVTVFDSSLVPIAERLVYRNHGRNLQIDVTPDRERYGPRDQVVLSVQTQTPGGEPVAAELALAVVDDAVIGLADDKQGHMLSRLYLEPELVDSPKDPGFYFDPEEVLAATAMDMVMGTRGHRRFEWQPVWEPVPVANTIDVEQVASGGPMRAGRQVPLRRKPQAAEPAPDAPVAAALAPEPEPEPMREAQAPPPPPAVQARPAKSRRRGRRAAEKEEVMAAEAKMDIALEDMDALGYIEGDEWHDVRQNRAEWTTARVFPEPNYRGGFTGVRTDFRDTVHWAPKVVTGTNGRGEVRFYLSDAVTSFRVTTEGIGSGFAGHHETTLSSVLPVSVATRLPPAVSAGDRLEVPVTVTNTRRESMSVAVEGRFQSDVVQATRPEGALTVEAGGTDTFWIPVAVGEGQETVSLQLTAAGGGLTDTVKRTLEVVPTGFPDTFTAAGEGASETFAFQLDEAVTGSLSASVTWHPGTVSTLIEGMEGMISTPGGCFEQTSSTNWPNVAILNYLEAHDGDPRLEMKSHQALKVGYDKLTGYQVAAGGFETWGSGPGKEALSAFGLLQFRDMQRVYPVADEIITRDAAYLLAQRTGKGGFRNTGESAHGYGSAPAEILDGFITFALVEGGFADELATEIEHQAAVARTTTDPYVLALAVRSLHGAHHRSAARATARLADLQAEDGSFPGAVSSITRSYEANLLVESTALGALALMQGGEHRSGADKAAQWLIDHRQGGTWGATQATALALSALTTHADVSRVPRSAGVVALEVNGTAIGTLSYGADHTDPLVIDGWQQALRTGENTLVVRQLEGTPLPFAVDVDWKSANPTSAPGAELSLSTQLSTTSAHMGDTVRLTATVHNQLDRIVPSPIARIGLPAGLEAQTWQLTQLQERGEIAFFETRPREVTLYWDGIHEGEDHEVKLDLVAVVPGRFTAPASSAYPYYNDDEKGWAPGPTITVER